MQSGPHRQQVCASALMLQGWGAFFGLALSHPYSSSVYPWELHTAWLLTTKWLFSAGHLGSINVLGNLPCQTILGKGHVRLTKSSDSSSHLSPVFIRSFEAIYLLSCHYIDSLLLRIINIVRAMHCLCSPANYKRQNRYLTSHAPWREWTRRLLSKLWFKVKHWKMP